MGDKFLQTIQAQVYTDIYRFMHSIQNRSIGCIILRMVGNKNQVLDGPVLRIVVSPFLPGLRNPLPPAFLQEGQVGIRATQQQNPVPQRIAASEHRKILHNDGICQRTHDFRGRNSTFDKIDNIGFGKYPALCGHMVQFRIIKMHFTNILHRHPDFDHTLVDHCSGT
ncbi:hypothetical protein D3C75_686100 [compost metagenome]